MTRDPLVHAGQGNLYEYVASFATLTTDPTGELMACADDCKDPCGDAKKKSFAGKSNGGVVCCDGKKYSCVWRVSPYPFIIDCTREHEDTHHDDIDCPPKGLCRPDFKKGKDKAEEECSAYKTHLKCLEGRSKDCDKLKGEEKKKCQEAYDAEVKRVKEHIDRWCKKVPKPKTTSVE